MRISTCEHTGVPGGGIFRPACRQLLVFTQNLTFLLLFNHMILFYYLLSTQLTIINCKLREADKLNCTTRNIGLTDILVTEYYMIWYISWLAATVYVIVHCSACFIKLLIFTEDVILYNFCLYTSCLQCFDAVAWVAGRHPACKNRVVGCWRDYLPGARCRLAYGPADATATHCPLLHKNPDWCYLSGTGSPG